MFGNLQKVQEYDDKMEVFWFSALNTQNLTDRPSDASCFLCQMLGSLMAELVPQSWYLIFGILDEKQEIIPIGLSGSCIRKKVNTGQYRSFIIKNQIKDQSGSSI